MSTNKGREAIRRALKRDLAPQRAGDPIDLLAITAPMDPTRPTAQKARAKEQGYDRERGHQRPPLRLEEE